MQILSKRDSQGFNKILLPAQVLPFPGYQQQAALDAIKRSLANVAIFVALDAVTPSSGAGEPEQWSLLMLTVTCI
jgi:hypothetical protein